MYPDKASNRQSHHLFDMVKMMDTGYCDIALHNEALYTSIMQNRKLLTPVRGISYNVHTVDRINFIPLTTCFPFGKDNIMTCAK